jgi:hypothetical protein
VQLELPDLKVYLELLELLVLQDQEQLVQLEFKGLLVNNLQQAVLGGLMYLMARHWFTIYLGHYQLYQQHT